MAKDSTLVPRLAPQDRIATLSLIKARSWARKLDLADACEYKDIM